MAGNLDQTTIKVLELSIQRLGETIERQGLADWLIPAIAKLSYEAEMWGDGGEDARRTMDGVLEQSLRIASERIESAGENGLSESIRLKVESLLSAVMDRDDNPEAVVSLASHLLQSVMLKTLEGLETKVPGTEHIAPDLLKVQRQWVEFRSKTSFHWI